MVGVECYNSDMFEVALTVSCYSTDRDTNGNRSDNFMSKSMWCVESFVLMLSNLFQRIVESRNLHFLCFRKIRNNLIIILNY